MKRTQKLLSILLTLALLLGMLPMTAMAAGPTEIDELTLSFMSENERPAVGEPIKYMSGGRLTETDDRIELTGNILLWCIDDSSTVINKTYDDTGMYYEAGRTYNSEIIVEVLDPEQYTIGENTKITLTNPGDFTYTSELSSIVETDSSFFAYMKLTITMNGERTYPDITKVVFMDLVSPTEGMSVTESVTDIHYSNCRMTSGVWLGDVWGKDEFDNNTFVAGETYTYRVVLTARDGYKFYENATIQLTSGGVTKAPSYYAYTDGNKALTLDYTYTIPSITWVDSVDATITRYYHNLTPIAGESASDLFTDTLKVDENAPYEIIGELDRTWYSEDGTGLTSNDRFEAGKTYYFNYSYSIKNEYRHLYRFSPDNLTTTIIGESYTGKGFQKAERVEYSNHDNTYVTFRYYFTAQFPDGAGSTANNPAMCYSYEEFKYAMEDPNIRYVALGNVDEVMPLVSMNDSSPYGDNRCPGIWVRGTKDLVLMGNAQFTAPNATENVHRVYENLLLVQSGSRLTISGTGSLTFHGNAVGWPTSVIQVTTDGVLFVDGGTITGDTGNRTAFCYGINVNGGKLYVNGGTVVGTNRHNQAPISAILLYDGVANIHDGTFYSNVSDGAAGSKHYGLTIEGNATCNLYGGGFKGISMPYASVMSDYIEDGYTLTVDGVKVNPASCGTTNGFVEVYQEISKINIHVNSPVAGESPATYDSEVYLVPEGATALAPVWYENGQPWNISSGSARFTAGNTYKVEIVLTADDGVKFANPLTSATVNSKNATVSAFAGNPETGVVLTVDLGECPNVVPQVNLSVTAPKEGNTPSYTVGCGSDAYYAVGGSSNYTEYRKWYMSSDNDDWWEINGSHTFMAGYYYKLYVDIRTNEGYEFPLIDTGTIQPNVSVTVNGYTANVYKAYEQDPSRHITVEYNFGECSDSVVEKIIVENVTAPVAGQKPSYDWSIRGTGYQMNTAKNAYYDVYWKNPPEKWYYVKNGLQWWDSTTGSWEYVYENDTFIPGHTYVCQLYLVAETGFAFATDKYSAPTVTATINGETAEINEDWTNATEARVYCTFTCEEQTVSTITLSDLDAPVGGEAPDTTITSGDPDLYTVESVTWTDVEEGAVGDVFESGIPYQVEIVVASVQAGGVDMVKFADANALTILVNGSQISYLTPVTVEDNKVTIQYTFRNPAAAPEIELYAFLTQPVGGELLAGEAHNTAWETNFIPTQTEIQYWDGEAWDQWDVQYPENALDDYDFESADAGTYRFRIVAYIGSDVVATSNEFTITWEEPVHNHSFDRQVVEAKYLASPADCDNPAEYYYSCSCGEQGDETFTYGTALGHTPGAAWEKNSTHHWHICTVSGCGKVVETSKEAHNPDHIGGATEEYAILCAVCGYVIEAQLAHTHVFDKQVVNTVYLKHEADCDNPAEYYYSCSCGEQGDETFTYGTALGHTPGAAWEKDSTHHWHICTVSGCGKIVETTKAAHTPDHSGGATEEYAIRCTVCGYVMEAQLSHSHVFDKQVVDTVYLKREADCVKPAEYYYSCACGEAGTEFFSYGSTTEHTPDAAWEKDSTHHWHACTVTGCDYKTELSVHDFDSAADSVCDICGYTRDLPPVVFEWDGETCFAYLTQPQNEIVLIAAYRDGQMITTVFLDAETPQADFAADEVKAFFLQKNTYIPVRAAIGTSK